MRYVDFRDSICLELQGSRDGLTWKQLKERLNLPYRTPCQEWIKRMENENGLIRTRVSGSAYLWRLKSEE